MDWPEEPRLHSPVMEYTCVSMYAFVCVCMCACVVIMGQFQNEANGGLYVKQRTQQFSVSWVVFSGATWPESVAVLTIARASQNSQGQLTPGSPHLSLEVREGKADLSWSPQFVLSLCQLPIFCFTFCKRLFFMN